MNRIHAAAAVLALAVVACHRGDRDKAEPASNTSTTSAEMETVDRADATAPMSAIVRSHDDESANVDSSNVGPNGLPVRDLGDIDEPAGAHTGARQPSRARAKASIPEAAPATPDMSGVGPGHIWYVPGGDTGKAKAGAKGEPNSAGSHNIGSGASTR